MSSIPFDVTPDALRSESAAIRSLSRALLGREQDAEDAEQETWLAALRHPAARINERSAWLARVARNFALRMRRKDEARRRWEREAARPESMPSTLETVERVALHQQIVDVVLGLDEPYRTTVLLRFWEDQPPRNVARLMGVPVSTVRTRVRRALAILRERLDHSCGSRTAWSGTLALGIENAPAVSAATVPAASLVLAGALLMTTKAKLAAVAVVCGVLLATLWALQEPSREDSLPHDPALDPGGGRLVAEEEGGGKMAAGNPSKRTQVPAQTTAEPKLGSLLVRATWAEDKTPAAGVLLKAGRYGSSDVLFDTTYGSTGDDGTLRLRDLKPGRMYVDLRWGAMGSARKRATIEAGKEAEVQMEIPVGIDVDGIVVDRAGSPVAGADIIVGPLAPVNAHCVAKSGADGRFRLRSLTICCVGARAPGHAPSPMHTIVGRQGANPEVRIVLSGRGGALHGRVFNPRGQPVPEAVIQIGTPRYDSVKLPDGSTGRSAMPVRLRSDDDGRFVAEGLAPGKTTVAVRARRLAHWIGTVDVLTDGSSELVVNLLPGVTLSGTVRDSNARPLKAAVRVGEFITLGYQSTETDAAGKYRLVGLGAGKLKIQADAGKWGKTRTELVAVAGQMLQWNPVISTGLVLRGRVVDQADKPVKAYVNASLANRGPGDDWSTYDRTDKDGWFQLRNCQAGRAVRIRVFAASYAEKLVDVRPDHQDLVIRVEPKGKRTVYFAGRVVDPDAKPVKEECWISYDSRQQRLGRQLMTFEAGAGRFRYGPYPPGEYRLQIQAKGYPMVQTAWKKLTENETWNLGVVRLQRPGFLQVSLEGEAGLLPQKGLFRILDSAREYLQVIRIRKGKADRSNPLAAGTYYLQVLGKDFLCALHKFEIRAGQDTRLEVPHQEGVPVVLEFLIQTDVGIVVPRRSVDVEIKDSSGRMILASAAWLSSRGPAAIAFAVRPGRYQITAASRTGKRAEATLTVSDKAVDPKRIVLH